MRILVTGAAGFIGSHLAEALAARGHAVTGLDAYTPYYSLELKEANQARLATAGVEVLPLDLATDVLGDAVSGVEVVYHLAAQPGISSSASFESYLRDNVVATHRLVEASVASPALRGFLNISTSSVYGFDASGAEDAAPAPVSWYGVTKLAGEQLALAAARDRGLPACSFRLFSVYGPRERPDKLFPRLLAAARTGAPFPLHEGSERHVRSYTYVGDIVEGLVRALDVLDRLPGEIVNLGTPQAMTTAEAIRAVEEVTGRPLRIEPRPRRPGDQMRTQANIAKARRLLRWEPVTTLRDGVARTWLPEN
jgi:nucleoside-diphosphate-sugar epimerase